LLDLLVGEFHLLAFLGGRVLQCSFLDRSMLKSAINVPEQQAVFRSPEVYIVLLSFYFFFWWWLMLGLSSSPPQLAWQLAQKVRVVVVATAAVFSMFFLKPSLLFPNCVSKFQSIDNFSSFVGRKILTYKVRD